MVCWSRQLWLLYRLKGSTPDKKRCIIILPFRLPKAHHVTALIIDHFHKKVQLQGRGITMNEIRSNGIWVLPLSSAVSSLIHKCVKCRRQRRPLEDQKMANLPMDRVEPSPSFTYWGMDCFGPQFNIQLLQICKACIYILVSYIIVVLWSKLILTAINVDTLMQTNKDLFSKNYFIN